MLKCAFELRAFTFSFPEQHPPFMCGLCFTGKTTEQDVVEHMMEYHSGPPENQKTVDQRMHWTAILQVMHI